MDFIIIIILNLSTFSILLSVPLFHYRFVRAAQRLAEASRYPASTIHRLLGSDVNGSDFLMNENNKLEAQALVIDEASMLDICLADALLKVVPRKISCSYILSLLFFLCH